MSLNNQLDDFILTNDQHPSPVHQKKNIPVYLQIIISNYHFVLP